MEAQFGYDAPSARTVDKFLNRTRVWRFLSLATVLMLSWVAPQAWAQNADAPKGGAQQSEMPTGGVQPAGGPTGEPQRGETPKGRARSEPRAGRAEEETGAQVHRARSAAATGPSQARTRPRGPSHPTRKSQTGSGQARLASSAVGRGSKTSGWGRIGFGFWFVSAIPRVYGGQATLVLEGGRKDWLGGRVVLGAAVLPLPADPLDGMSSFQSMTAGAFGVGPVLRLSGLKAVARKLKVPLDLELAILVSLIANRPMVALAAELEFDVRYALVSGWWFGGAVKAGWWQVMTEAVEGDLTLGPAVGAAFETGWSW